MDSQFGIAIAPQHGSVSDSPKTPHQQNTKPSNRHKRSNKPPKHTSSHSKREGHAQVSAPQSDPYAGLGQGDGADQAEDESQDATQPNKSYSGQKQRSKTKKPHQPKNQSMSGTSHVDGTPSPRTHTASHNYNASAVVATPTKQAYAGPTFHASPAASALPIPKFMSRSVPGSSAPSNLHDQLDPDSGKDDSSISTTEEQEASKQVAREESPLDVLFNAHRAEQAQRSASRSQTSLTPASAQGQRHTSSPRPHTTAGQLNRTHSGLSGKDIFMMELDGTGEGGGSDDSKLPHVPFKERISGARSPSDAVRTEKSNYTMDSEDRRIEQSQALKRLLMSHEQTTSSLTSSTSNSRQWNGSTEPPFTDINQSPSTSQGNFVPARVVPVTNTPLPKTTLPPSAAEAQSSEVKEMESNLRRMLKLDN